MGRLDPHTRSSSAVMVRAVGVHREQLVLHTKRRLPPRFHLVGFRKGETDFAKLDQRRCLHYSDIKEGC